MASSNCASALSGLACACARAASSWVWVGAGQRRLSTAFCDSTAATGALGGAAKAGAERVSRHRAEAEKIRMVMMNTPGASLPISSYRTERAPGMFPLLSADQLDQVVGVV